MAAYLSQQTLGSILGHKTFTFIDMNYAEVNWGGYTGSSGINLLWPSDTIISLWTTQMISCFLSPILTPLLFNLLAPEKCSDSKSVILEQMLWIIHNYCIWNGECATSLMKSWHWFCKWLGAIRCKAIPEPMLTQICHSMVSLGHTELNCTNLNSIQ